MHQDIVKTIHSYLPEINTNELNFDIEKIENDYINDLNHFTEIIQSWAFITLEKSKLPTSANDAKALITKYNLDTDEGCALHMVIELESIKQSILQNDAATIALASMKLMDQIWHSSIFRGTEKNETQNVKSRSVEKETDKNSNKDENIALYQSTINDLKEKYPHCNLNALRLLAATRLNIGKQELDDLNITPE